jgi:hypothetical protein
MNRKAEGEKALGDLHAHLAPLANTQSSLSESKAANLCKIDVYNFADSEAASVATRHQSWIVRHFGS